MSSKVRKHLKIEMIKNGTAIDHVRNGKAMEVLRILGVDENFQGTVSVAINVPSKRSGMKDMVKVEGRELNPKEVDKIALLAPHATINIVRDYKVAEKERVKLPKVIRGILKCANPACISNSKEPVQPTFYVEKEDPLRLRCHYCGYIMEKQDVLKQF